eukprot:gene1444-biopygen1149
MERSARCLELALQVRDLEERRGRAAGESTPLRQQINGLEETLAQELAAAEREREAPGAAGRGAPGSGTRVSGVPCRW